MTNKNNYSLHSINGLNLEKKLKSSESNKNTKFNKLGKSQTLTENNSIKDKKMMNKLGINYNKLKLKQSQDNKIKMKMKKIKISKKIILNLKMNQAEKIGQEKNSMQKK